ncbi:hypothetical protein [Streptomyces roseochromogenus]|uniref:STAS domain-containing protein n=1 Tax=Streptomyces roseochromogenus subsp. oscitans DS 12.976 TaxID=1352936 RepID=V6KUL6_STRRC|nr:hypothetical protein [Streptomyces roseochromogenus]EST35683.1 hypothetical protein M878_04735 [Streptomyces roseochromogenus subsp. oscitans DS 12.976]
MTIDWRYTIEQDLGVLSVAGYLGPEAVRRFSGAIGWVVARGTGPVVLDLTELRSWSAEGQLAITEAARRLAESGRSLELAAIPADGSLVPAGDCPDIPVHCDLATALAAHGRGPSAPAEGQQEWRTDGWPAA